jgi:hypothetical protein
MNTERITKVLALAMAANPDLPIPLSLDNIDLDDITSTPNAKRNTRATMYALDTGEIVRYVGNTDVVYDRIEIDRYWERPALIENPSASTVKDLVAILRNRYGLDVLDTEVLNSDDVLPSSGTVKIMIDDSVSPLYIGEVDVAFTKDAGLSEQDGVAYSMGGAVGDTPIVAYSDTKLNLQGSLNSSNWTVLATTRNPRTQQYEYRFNAPLTQAQNDVRIRGGAVTLMGNTGVYVPITRLTTYRGAIDATGFCAGIRTLTTVDPNVFQYRKDLRSADYMFDGCSALVNVPEHLFSPCQALKSAVAVFRKTGIVTVPATVFESCTQLTTLESAFEQCTRLTTIPATLFRSNLALVSLRRCFLGCTGATSNFAVPALLAPLTNLQNISYLFGGCPAITALPVNLLANQTALVDASGAFSGLPITSIPTGLFATNIQLQRLSSVFADCKQLTGIPPGLFQGLTNLEYLDSAFARSGILTTPAVMFTYTRRLLSIDSIFTQCLGLNAIPVDLLKPLLRVQSINGVWRGCTNITTIPEALLAFNTNVLSAQWLFASTGVTAIPSALFAQTTKLTDLTGAFAYTPMSSISDPTIFKQLTQLAVINQLFYKCTQLAQVAAPLFSSNVSLRSMRGTFAYSGLAINVGALFANMGSVAQVQNIAGLYQGCAGMVGGFVVDLQANLANSQVKWTDAPTTQGCVAGNTQLSDYATVGAIYKTPVPTLM